MTALGIDLVTAADQTVVKLTGELDMAAVPDLIARAHAAMAQDGFRVLVFDLTALTFMDTSGIGVMVTLDRECRAQRASFRIAGPSKRIRKTLELVGLDNWFETDEAQP